jgi:hypothetical protein
VLVSVDGSTLGGSGARRFADDLEEPGLIDAVIVVSGSAAPRSRGPLIVAWSNDSSRGNIGLERTAAGGLRAELESLPRQEGVFGQLARLAFPIGLGDQGVLLERGLDAVRISGSGELAPPEDARGVDDVDVERYGDFGRGLLQTVFAIEAGDHPRHGPETYLTIAGKTLPGWAISLLAITLLLPALVASVDALARTRRRRHPVRPFVHWLASAVLPFAIGLALAELLVLAGLAEDAPPAPLDPTARPFDGAAAATLAAVTLTIALAWVLGRSPVLRGSAPLPDAGEPGAGCVVALALSVAGLAVWVVNPFAALVLVPAVHLVAIVALTELRTRASAAMLAVALLPPLAILAYYLHRFSLDPLEGAWYLFLLVTGHHAGLATALTGCLLLGTLGCAAAIVLARRRSQRAVDERRDAEDRERPRVLGPGGHAGPGALGGTESTLRR